MNEVMGNSNVTGKHLVIVDIQPEYEKFLSFNLYEFIEFLNSSQASNITFLYNGESLGMTSESDLHYWYVDNGLDENILSSSIWFDKGYAFFRYCMDNYLEEEKIVEVVRFMIDNDITDSRDITENHWEEFINMVGSTDAKEMLQFASDCISILDLIDELQNYSNIVICGGGINECLKEVEIALLAINKPYSVLTKYIY